jgi:hypothetical protein
MRLGGADRTGGGGERRERAQLVLAAAAVVAVALAPVVLAYLQLGAHPDVRAPAPEPGASAERFLERATHEAGSEVTGDAWSDRRLAVAEVRESLAPRLRTLETSRVEWGTVFRVAYAPEVAAEWAANEFPRGAGRAFGTCRAVDGVVVQERAGETTVLTVAYDVTVTSEEGRREFTFLVPVVG